MSAKKIGLLFVGLFLVVIGAGFAATRNDTAVVVSCQATDNAGVPFVTLNVRNVRIEYGLLPTRDPDELERLFKDKNELAKLEKLIEVRRETMTVKARGFRHMEVDPKEGYAAIVIKEGSRTSAFFPMYSKFSILTNSRGTIWTINPDIE